MFASAATALGYFAGPVEPGQKLHAAIVELCRHANAVELDFAEPLRTAGGFSIG